MLSKLYGRKYYKDPHNKTELIDLSLTKIESCFDKKEDVFIFAQTKYSKIANDVTLKARNPLIDIELFLIGDPILQFSESKSIVKKLLKYPKSLSSKNMMCIGDDDFINKMEAILTSFNFDCHVIYMPTQYKTIFHLMRFSKNYIEHNITHLPVRYSTYYSKTIILSHEILEFNKKIQTQMYLEFLKLGMLFDKKLFNELLKKLTTFDKEIFSKIFIYFVKKFQKNKKLDRFFFGSAKIPMIMYHKKFYNFTTEYLEKFDIHPSQEVTEYTSIMINLLVGAKLKITSEDFVNKILKAFAADVQISQALSTITNYADSFYLDFKKNKMNSLFIKAPAELKYYKHDKKC